MPPCHPRPAHRAIPDPPTVPSPTRPPCHPRPAHRAIPDPPTVPSPTRPSDPDAGHIGETASLSNMTTGATRASSRIALVLAIVGLTVIVLAACARTPSSPDAQLRGLVAAVGVTELSPIESPTELYELGAALFFDPVLSGNRDVSCATCHEPDLATADRQSLAIGTGGLGRGEHREIANAFLHVPRSSSDLFNRGDAEWHTFFWDGRVAIVDGRLVTPAGAAMPADVSSVQVAQAMITIASPIEMRGFPGDLDVEGNLNELALFAPDEWDQIWEATLSRVLAHDEYRALFAAAYPHESLDSLEFYHAVRALVAFQAEAFTSVGSPFDQFLAGDASAMSDVALEGALLFFGEAGCAQCHSGPLLTDQSFYSISAPQVGPGRGDVAPLEAGHGAIDGSGVLGFRTPPLRNVAQTPPYLHDGAYWDLADVVRHHLDPLASLTAYDPTQLRGDVSVEHLPDVAERVRDSLSDELMPRQLSEDDIALLVVFLESLSDPAVANLGLLVPSAVPSGLELYPEKTG